MSFKGDGDAGEVVERERCVATRAGPHCFHFSNSRTGGKRTVGNAYWNGAVARSGGANNSGTVLANNLRMTLPVRSRQTPPVGIWQSVLRSNRNASFWHSNLGFVPFRSTESFVSSWQFLARGVCGCPQITLASEPQVS